ncbi:hypothetical protein ES703_110802 [subsurface metagenome]
MGVSHIYGIGVVEIGRHQHHPAQYRALGPEDPLPVGAIMPEQTAGVEGRPRQHEHGLALSNVSRRVVKIQHGIYTGGNQRNLVPELADVFAAGHGHRAFSAAGCRQGRIADPQHVGQVFTGGVLGAGSPGPAAVSAVVDIGVHVSTGYQRGIVGITHDIQADDVDFSSGTTNIKVKSYACRKDVCH